MKMEILNKVMAPTNESIGAQHWKTHRKRGRGRSRSGRASVPGTAAKRYSKKDTVIAATTGRAIHHRAVLRCSLFFMMTFILFLAMISFSLAIIFPAITRRVETNRTTTTDRPLFSPEMANEDESLGPQKKKTKKRNKKNRRPSSFRSDRR